jgi:hypothetical protein
MHPRQRVRVINFLSAINNKLLVGGIFYDFHKAFDSVNYDILLSKMEFYGITGTTHNLIKSYLQDRYQRVLTNFDSNKYYSKWDSVLLESLKDPYLVPCFFLLYVNDLPNAISDISKPILYADDTSLIITNSDINTVILRLNRWFHSNLLLLNFETTYFLQFLTKNSNAQYTQK